MTNLLPCPFCGGEADTLKANNTIFPWSVSHACQAIGGGIVTTGFLSEAAAIEAWNTRAERTCHDLETMGGLFVCSACGEVETEGTHVIRYNGNRYEADQQAVIDALVGSGLFKLVEGSEA